MEMSTTNDKTEPEASADNNQQTTREGTERKYSSEEVAEIIRISLQEDSGSNEESVDYEELLAIAQEVGVDSARIDRAVDLLEDEQAARDKERYLWSRFHTHFILFIAVNLLCVVINVFDGSSTFWSLYVIFGWGLFLLGHYAGLRYAPGFVELAMERTQHVANNKYREYFEDDDIVGFTIPDPMGLTESQGIISLEDDKLLIEYQTMDCMVGFLKTRVKVTEIELENLTSARLVQGLWATELVLGGKNLRTFGNSPGSAGGKLKLKINRLSRRAAERLTRDIREVLKQKPGG